MNTSYITVRNTAHDEFIMQKSRFIGYASPCSDEDDAQSFIKSIKEKYRDAKHHCFGYIIGRNSGIMRYSDDGEPNGTAGLPIMNVLKGLDVVNCCVVVVRYFGGILLGTGGLVRAYTEGCKKALDAAGIVRMEMSGIYQCEVPYAVWDQIQYSIQSLPASIDSVSYGQNIRFHLYARIPDAQMVLDTLQKRTNRKLSFSTVEERYVDWSV